MHILLNKEFLFRNLELVKYAFLSLLVQIHVDSSSGDVFVHRIGPNISKLNDVALEKDRSVLMKNNDIIYLLDDEFPFKLIKSNQSSSQKTKTTKLKQASVSTFLTSPKKRKVSDDINGIAFKYHL